MLHLLLGALLVAGNAAAALAQVASVPTDPVGVVKEYIAAQNRHDVDRMLSLLADRVEIRIGLGATPSTSDTQSQMRERLTRIAQLAPNARTEVLDLITDGPVVMTRERTTGLADGGTETGLAIYRVRNGKIGILWVVSSSTLGER